MELRDFIVTPIIIFLVYAGAYWIRPRVTDSINRKYFIPALTVRIIGALAVGFIYQFYYDGGDTFNFHTHGSRHVWEAFMEDPSVGFKILFSSGEYDGSTFKYASKILFYNNNSSLTIIKIAAILDLLTFSSYSATAILFAVVSFVGLWLLYKVFYEYYPSIHQSLAVACFFIPSVFFWGSGLLKDTITLTATSISVFCVHQLIIKGKKSLFLSVVLIFFLYVLYIIKIYILLILLPSIIIWVFLSQIKKVRGLMRKILVTPIVLSIAFILAGYSLIKAAEDNPKYSLSMIAKTAKITAYDIRFWTGRDAGSGYTLGELDGTFNSLLSLAPQAINVALFRPYLWEVKNPLMLISSIESTFFMGIFIFLGINSGRYFFYAARDPIYTFCLIFSIIFAFGVGVSTFNFGTLSRYKIPLLPFFLIALIIVNYHSNKAKKFSVFVETE